MLTNIHSYNPINPIFIQFGSFTVYKYAIMILLGIIAALVMGLSEGKKIGIKDGVILDGLIIILPLAIIGARLWYIMFDGVHNFRHFFPFAGLAIHGGIFVAVIGTLIYAKRKKLDVFKLFDVLAPGLLIGQAFGRWGNFFNQEAHGGVIGGLDSYGLPNLSLDAQRNFLTATLRLPEFITNQMFGSSYLANNAYYHPTFLYESVWNILGLVLMLVLRRTRLIRSGDLIGIYLIWYSFGRFFIESLRTDALMFFNTSIRTAQMTSVLLFIVGIIIMVFNRLMNRRLYIDNLKTLEK